MDGQGSKRRRKIAENFNRLSRVHERYKRQTDGRAIAYSERENVSSRSLKIENNRVNRWLLAYMFTKFGRGRLNSGGERRARLYGGEKISSYIELP